MPPPPNLPVRAAPPVAPVEAVPLLVDWIETEGSTTVVPEARPLMIAVELSPVMPATTGTTTCLPARRTVTVAFEPLPDTAEVGTWTTLSSSAVTTETVALIPGLRRLVVLSIAKVTL